jgi:hypothetical protein
MAEKPWPYTMNSADNRIRRRFSGANCSIGRRLRLSESFYRPHKTSPPMSTWGLLYLLHCTSFRLGKIDSKRPSTMHSLAMNFGNSATARPSSGVGTSVSTFASANGPAAIALLAEQCTVTMAHLKTRDISEHCRRAELLVVTVGRPALIRGGWIKLGAIVVELNKDAPISRASGTAGRILCRPILGGLHHQYARA